MVSLCAQERRPKRHAMHRPLSRPHFPLLAPEAVFSLGLILSQQFPGTLRMLQAALAYQFQGAWSAVDAVDLIHLSPAGWLQQAVVI